MLGSFSIFTELGKELNSPSDTPHLLLGSFFSDSGNCSFTFCHTPCLISDLRRKEFNLSLLNMMLVVVLQRCLYWSWRHSHLFWNCWISFVKSGRVGSSTFSHESIVHVIFGFQSITLMYPGNWFWEAHVCILENKSQLIMVQNSFLLFLFILCSYYYYHCHYYHHH